MFTTEKKMKNQEMSIAVVKILERETTDLHTHIEIGIIKDIMEKIEAEVIEKEIQKENHFEIKSVPCIVILDTMN